MQIRLPGRADGSGPLVIPEPGWAASYPPPTSRRVYAAAHVAARPGPGGEVIDWESTLRFRDHLWAHGFGVAEAMDTAQRGMGLSWEQARELIARSARRAAEIRGAPARGTDVTGPVAALACGVGTDQLRDGEAYPIGTIISAYAEQMAFVQSTGPDVILMASRALAVSARGARDYLEVYGELLQQANRPVILHWLGEAFDPALRGYWGSTDFDVAADTVLELIERADGQVDGIKLSVLDPDREVALRRRLPTGVRLYTGDDYNYAELIRGDAAGSEARHSEAAGSEAGHTRDGDTQDGDTRDGDTRDGDTRDGDTQDGDTRDGDIRDGDTQDRGPRDDEAGHSDALLGAFAAITAPAAAALAALDRGDLAGYDAAMAPTVSLSRVIFEPPTYCYKVGVAFLAWLNGFQPYFAMLGGLQRQRPTGHLIRVFELAAAARALADPELAAGRMSELLATFAAADQP